MPKQNQVANAFIHRIGARYWDVKRMRSSLVTWHICSFTPGYSESPSSEWPLKHVFCLPLIHFMIHFTTHTQKKGPEGMRQTKSELLWNLNYREQPLRPLDCYMARLLFVFKACFVYNSTFFISSSCHSCYCVKSSVVTYDRDQR